MAITKALMYARLSSTVSTGTGLYKKARLGATRLNYFGPKQLLKVNSTLRSGNFNRDTWVVTERGRGQGKTLRIDLFGFTPAVGQEIILGAGSISNRLFRGTITRIRQVRQKLNDGRLVYDCQCVDWTYQLANLKVTKKYTNSSATTIAQDLIASFAPAGFTSLHVQGGLATLDEFQCTMQFVPSALQQLCTRIGGAFYVDADKDLHLYVGTDPTGVNPQSLTDSNPHLFSAFTYESDIEGLRNRILVESKGASVTSAVDAGTTSIPVQDTSAFETSGTNHAKLEAQRITYTGVSSRAGQGCTTAGVPGSAPSPPAVVQSLGAVVSAYVAGNLGVGTFLYKTTFVNASGETSASSAASGAIAAVEDTQISVSLTPTTGGSMAPSTAYSYLLTYGTALGETIGTFIGTAVLSGVQNAVGFTNITLSGDGRVTKRKLYRFLNSASAYKLVTTINDNTTTSFTDTLADASLGVAAPTANTAGSGKMDVASVAIGPAGTTSRKVYRTAVNDSTFKLLTTIADNTTTTYLDNTADGSLGAALGTSTIGAAAGDTTLRVSDLSMFPDGGWVRTGSQVLHFTARSTTSGEGTLTGIPATGAGAILSAIPAGSALVVEPHVTGIPASGTGAIAHSISIGEQVNPLTIAEDLTSQGTYGIREDSAQDRRIVLDAAEDLGNAQLALLKDPRVSGSFTSSDPKLGAGRALTIAHTAWGLTASVTVQTITIKPRPDRPQPLLEAQVASRSMDDLYAQLRDIREQLART